MKITSLEELIDRGQTTGATAPGVEYLVKNPSDYIKLVKQDIILAELYAKEFNLQQIENIAEGNPRFFASLYALINQPSYPHEISLIKTPLDLNKENFSEYMKPVRMDSIINDPADKSTYYYFDNDHAFKLKSKGDFLQVEFFNEKVCELAYKKHYHAHETKRIIKNIIFIMLEHLKSSLKEFILIKEFADDFFSNALYGKYYLIDGMIKNKDYEWLEKIIPCISKKTLIEQLDKSQARMGALTAEVSGQFDKLIALKEKELAPNTDPSAPPVFEITPKLYLDALTRIAELEQEVQALKAQLKAGNQPSTLNAYTKSLNGGGEPGPSTFYPKFN